MSAVRTVRHVARSHPVGLAVVSGVRLAGQRPCGITFSPIHVGCERGGWHSWVVRGPSSGGGVPLDPHSYVWVMYVLYPPSRNKRVHAKLGRRTVKNVGLLSIDLQLVIRKQQRKGPSNLSTTTTPPTPQRGDGVWSCRRFNTTQDVNK